MALEGFPYGQPPISVHLRSLYGHIELQISTLLKLPNHGLCCRFAWNSTPGGNCFGEIWWL